MSELLNAVESVVLGPIAGPVVSAIQSVAETVIEPTTPGAPLFSAADAEAAAATGGSIEAVLQKIQTAAKGGYYSIQVLSLSEGQQSQLEGLGYRVEPVLDTYGQISAIAGLTGPGQYTQHKILWGRAASEVKAWDPSKIAAALRQAQDAIGKL